MPKPLPAPPGFLVYVSDWGRPALRACSDKARNAWIDLQCLANHAERRGYLALDGAAITTEQLARVVGLSSPKMAALLKELEGAGGFERTEQGVIYFPTMVRDEAIRQKRAKGGERSLDNPRVPKPKGGGPSGGSFEGGLQGGPSTPFSEGSLSVVSSQLAVKDPPGKLVVDSEIEPPGEIESSSRARSREGDGDWGDGDMPEPTCSPTRSKKRKASTPVDVIGRA